MTLANKLKSRGIQGLIRFELSIAAIIHGHRVTRKNLSIRTRTNAHLGDVLGQLGKACNNLGETSATPRDIENLTEAVSQHKARNPLQHTLLRKSWDSLQML